MRDFVHSSKVLVVLSILIALGIVASGATLPMIGPESMWLFLVLLFVPLVFVAWDVNHSRHAFAKMGKGWQRVMRSIRAIMLLAAAVSLWYLANQYSHGSQLFQYGEYSMAGVLLFGGAVLISFGILFHDTVKDPRNIPQRA